MKYACVATRRESAVVQTLGTLQSEMRTSTAPIDDARREVWPTLSAREGAMEEGLAEPMSLREAPPAPGQDVRPSSAFLTRHHEEQSHQGQVGGRREAGPPPGRSASACQAREWRQFTWAGGRIGGDRAAASTARGST